MKLRLKGFKGIKAGPDLTLDGLDEIHIDFTGRQGLTAFAGQNGTGKSTVLENLHHYPQLVSRDGALWSHVKGRTAEKEFESEFMGSHYRSLIKMDADQGKQEGYLWIDGKSVVNGKITAYRERVYSIFGQPFTYFRSQFCPQKSKTTRDMQIENMTTGIFRGLLHEFLNLQRYAVWEDAAKQTANKLQEKINVLAGRLTILRAMIGKKTELELAYADAGGRAENLRDSKTILEQEIKEKRQVVDDLKEQVGKNKFALERKKDIQLQIDRFKEEADFSRDVATAELKTLGSTYTALKQDILACICILEERSKIENAVDILNELEQASSKMQIDIDERAKDMPEYQNRVHEIELIIAKLAAERKSLEREPIIIEAQRQLADLGFLLATAKQAHKAVQDDKSIPLTEEKIRAAENKMKSLDLRDPACQSSTCDFIVEALRAREKLPELKDNLVKLRKEIDDKKTEALKAIKSIEQEIILAKKSIDQLQAEIQLQQTAIDEKIKATNHDLRNAQQVVMGYGDMLAALQKNLMEIKAKVATKKILAAKISDVRLAESRKADLEKQLAEITDTGMVKKAAWESREIALKTMIQSERDRLDAIAINPFVEGALLTAQETEKKLEISKITLEKESEAVRDKLATIHADIRLIEAAVCEAEDAQRQRELLVKDVASWRYLQIACGKTGLPNLRIDGAAPRIVYNANRLLLQAYGALYSIRLETQNEEGREDLKVKIIMENGGEVYLDDISGGQRTWCVQALWLAMSLLNQEKSGKHFTYFCADENDGALDAANAENFTALYLPFMLDGRLDDLVFISHKAACRAMADNILVFEHGKNPEWA